VIRHRFRRLVHPGATLRAGRGHRPPGLVVKIVRDGQSAGQWRPAQQAVHVELRPPERRAKVVGLALTLSEYERLRAAAKSYRMKVTPLIRQLVLAWLDSLDAEAK
jgi:hypothetical protein